MAAAQLELAKATDRKPMTAADIRAGIKRLYPSPTHAVVFEVGNSTGATTARHVDADAMDLCPSRGLAIHGIEIKVRRANFGREIATPQKAEAVAQYCHRFSIATPLGLVGHKEGSRGLGVIKVTQDGKALWTKREPIRTGPRPSRCRQWHADERMTSDVDVWRAAKLLVDRLF
jgi:hypothetical protein